MTEEQLQLYNNLTTLQQSVALCRVNMPLSSDAEVYKLGGGTAEGLNSVTTCAHQLLNNANVKRFLDTFIPDRIDQAIMSRDAMIESLSHIADADISDILKFTDNPCVNIENGLEVWQSTVRVRNMDELSTLQRKMIKSVKQTKYGIELTLHDAMQAKKQLAILCGYEAAKKTELTITPESRKELTDDEFQDELVNLGIKID